MATCKHSEREKHRVRRRDWAATVTVITSLTIIWVGALAALAVA